MITTARSAPGDEPSEPPAAAKRSLRITCVIHSLAGGGAERVMAALASALSRRGHQVTLITLDNGRQDRHDVAAEVRRVALDLSGPSRGPLAAVAGNARRMANLRRAVRATQADVVLSFCDRTNVLTLLSMLACSIPVVVSERSEPAAQQMPWPWSWLRRKLYRRAAEVVVLTPTAAQTVAPWSARSPLVIPSAIEPPPLASGAMHRYRPTDDGGRSVIGIGRLEVEKGFDRLLEAFAAVADQHRYWELTIYGEGSCRGQLERQREQLGLVGRVHFPGWVRPIWPVLQNSDLFVLPSRYEGFPSALLEAMSAAVACVAFDCPSGPGMIVRHGTDALLVPDGDTAALAAAMDRCMSDAALRASLGSRAAEVSERFGWQAMVDAYEQVLLSHGAERAPRPLSSTPAPRIIS